MIWSTQSRYEVHRRGESIRKWGRDNNRQMKLRRSLPRSQCRHIHVGLQTPPAWHPRYRRRP